MVARLSVQRPQKPEDHFWLTLCLEGSPKSYAEIWPKLKVRGWQNLSETDEFSGFAYPKKEVRNFPESVREALLGAVSVCDGMGIGIGMVDADTEFDPADSVFRNLYKS